MDACTQEVCRNIQERHFPYNQTLQESHFSIFELWALPVFFHFIRLYFFQRTNLRRHPVFNSYFHGKFPGRRDHYEKLEMSLLLPFFQPTMQFRTHVGHFSRVFAINVPHASHLLNYDIKKGCKTGIFASYSITTK